MLQLTFYFTDLDGNRFHPDVTWWHFTLAVSLFLAFCPGLSLTLKPSMGISLEYHPMEQPWPGKWGLMDSGPLCFPLPLGALVYRPRAHWKDRFTLRLLHRYAFPPFLFYSSTSPILFPTSSFCNDFPKRFAFTQALVSDSAKLIIPVIF